MHTAEAQYTLRSTSKPGPGGVCREDGLGDREERWVFCFTEDEVKIKPTSSVPRENRRGWGWERGFQEPMGREGAVRTALWSSSSGPGTSCLVPTDGYSALQMQPSISETIPVRNQKFHHPGRWPWVSPIHVLSLSFSIYKRKMDKMISKLSR